MIRVQVIPQYVTGEIHPLLREIGNRLKPALLERGIEWDCDPAVADLVWACQHQYLARTDLPMIVHDLIDWGSLNWMGRECLAAEWVKAVFKGSYINSLEAQNGPHFEDTFHGAFLYEHAAPSERPQTLIPGPLLPKLTAADLHKVKPAYNWLFEKRLWHLAELRPDDSGRDLDVSFAGTMTYSRWHVEWHREQVIGRLERLSGRNMIIRQRALSGVEYDAMLSRSRVVISPWGCGETCVRDLEALLAGCVLVKPDSRFTTTWPEYHHEPHCLMFKPDLSDFDKIVEQALDLWKELQENRMATQARMIGLRSTECFADRIESLIRSTLSPE